MTAARAWLTDADRGLLQGVTDAATAGHWMEDQDGPLFAAVNLIVATHLQAQGERIARAIEDVERDHPVDSIDTGLAFEVAARIARQELR